MILTQDVCYQTYRSQALDESFTEVLGRFALGCVNTKSISSFSYFRTAVSVELASTSSRDMLYSISMVVSV